MKQGWEIKKLGEVLIIERGGSPRPIEKYITNSPDGLNWIKISDATASDKYIYETKEKITRDGLHKTRVVNEGDFILSNSMSFGRPYIMKTSGCIHDGWLVLRQNGKKLFETEFLYYLLSSPFVFNQFNELAAGSTVRNLNIALVSSVTVPIPPLPEQLRIVRILDEAFASIARAKANAEQNLKNAKELFECYLMSVFANKSRVWEERRLGDIAELIMGQSPPGTSYNSDNNGVPLINGPVEFGQDPFSKTIKSKFTTKPTKFCKENDLILCVRGSTTGRINIAGFDACIGRGVAAIRYSENQCWLNYFILASRQKIYELGSGATFPNVSTDTLKKLIIPLPPLSEQHAIVKNLDSLLSKTKKLESIYRQKLNDLKELQKSILHKAFNGELKTT